MTRNYTALVAYLDRMANVPFDWDGNCCARFSLGAIVAEYGSAPTLPFQWKTALGAKRIINSHGGMVAIINNILEPITPAQAIRGDIGGYEDPDLGIGLLVVEGQTLVGPSEKGTRRAPRSLMTMAWRAAPEAVSWQN